MICHFIKPSALLRFFTKTLNNIDTLKVKQTLHFTIFHFKKALTRLTSHVNEDFIVLSPVDIQLDHNAKQ